MPLINLICLPYAGGNAYSYNSFRRYFDGKLNMVTPELPGRGANYGGTLVRNLYTMADSVFKELFKQMNEPYALYGHSMGGLLAYLVARKAARERLPMPVHLFCSGCAAPSVPGSDAFHQLPDDLFIAKLRALGGSDETILNSRELMEFYLPVIRADFEASETFEYRPGIKLNIPVTVMNGKEDDISEADAAAWQMETSRPLSILNFPGDHFFIFEHIPAISNIIINTLLGEITPPATQL
jgi:surfactin synthase thioesterase subunit